MERIASKQFGRDWIAPNQHLRQKMYFSANCMIRPPLPVGDTEPVVEFEVVILPNVAGELKIRPGFARRTLLVTLKASARSSRFCPSVMRNCRDTVWSHSQNLGP